ncbi:hypothetical protein BJP43_05040 [Candidatus Williamhamiltonella defendens]|uniref:Uncharacterized protein n=1 Tax=Candidatus Williamhamiltonella defendens TaxID=138072 RepID=A0A2D3TD92_9ENTR|nr:hypothetical protein BJP43_05040 [Candidatus Hamiltonella defensa]AYB48224.1 hypothetical protein CJJ19_00170 [Candidatus Hamiltonella defensa]
MLLLKNNTFRNLINVEDDNLCLVKKRKSYVKLSKFSKNAQIELKIFLNTFLCYRCFLIFLIFVIEERLKIEFDLLLSCIG